MNNKSEQQKSPYDVFFIGSFFYCISMCCRRWFISCFNGWQLIRWRGMGIFYTFFIVFIPSVITTFVFYITQEKASSYYSRYLLLALLMPTFLIQLLATLFDLIYLNSWHDAIDTLVEYYLTHGIWACILGVAQLVLAQACFIKIWDTQ